MSARKPSLLIRPPVCCPIISIHPAGYKVPRAFKNLAVLTRLFRADARSDLAYGANGSAIATRRSPCRRLSTLIRPSERTRHRVPRRTIAGARRQAVRRFSSWAGQDDSPHAAAGRGFLIGCRREAAIRCRKIRRPSKDRDVAMSHPSVGLDYEVGVGHEGFSVLRPILWRLLPILARCCWDARNRS